MGKYETVIGLEIHCQLLTESKMFCSCSTRFGAEPNSNICEICTGQPGVLPKMNKKAIELAIKTALALNCKIEPKSIFARKNYFYPDLPKNYQISQYELPLATGGCLEIEVEGKKKKIGITRVHLEEDAGKLVHLGAERIMGSEASLADYNRTGTPLMEIVSEPDIRSPLEAKVYMETLAHLLQYIGVSDAKMEEGSLRCDANISIRPIGQKEFGTKTELKNVNSFRYVFKGLEAEEARHLEMAESGEKIIQETRYFDTDKETTKSMRTKEYAHDYRYFPEPDLVDIEPEQKWIDEIKKTIGKTPEERKKDFINRGASEEIADNLIYDNDKGFANLFENATGGTSKEDARSIGFRIMKDIKPYTKEKNKTLEELEREREITLSELAKSLRELNLKQHQGEITGSMASSILREYMDFETKKPISELIAKKGKQISGEEELIKIVQEVISKNPKQVEQFKSGKDTVIMFLVGQVMKATKGRAKPDLAQKLLRQELVK